MLADNLKQVQEQIASALDKRKNKDLLTGDKVTLVAVTKNHPPEIITDIEALGIANVGENRVQEAKHKQEALGKHGYWHLSAICRRTRHARLLPCLTLLNR